MLWMLLVLQICIIFCFWCMQTGYTSEHSNTENSKPTANKNIFLSIRTKEKIKASPFFSGSVNFVTKIKENIENKKKLKQKMINTLENVSNFARDYIKVETYRLMNITGIETEMDNDYTMGIIRNIWCFRQGTIYERDNWQIFWNEDTQQPQCKCHRNWHGKDCSQNEVIYRALMLPRNELLLWEPYKVQHIHFLVYMLEGYFCSLDFLELQINSVKSVVDHFLIIWKKTKLGTKSLKAFKRKLNELLQPERFTLYQCEIEKCNQMKIFTYFREKLNERFQKNLQSTDLLFYTNENVVLSKEILNFFKYNAKITNETQFSTWHFRLIYNVYGFFWQHPQKTYISGLLSSLKSLFDDPKRLQMLINNNETSSSSSSISSNGLRIIGDLNHFGGWYCQFCKHPDEIIAELNEIQAVNLNEKRNADESNLVKLPNVRNSYIDSKYLENLIAQGIHIDGKTHLEKVRMNSDDAYAPVYAEKLKWKFGNLLTNLFEAMENEYVLDEAEGGFGF